MFDYFTEKNRLINKEQAAKEKRKEDLEKVGSWECGMCKTVNQSIDYKCKTCFSSKPRPAMDLAYNDISSLGGGFSSRDTSAYSRSKSAPRGGGSGTRFSTGSDLYSTGKSSEISSSAYLSTYATSYSTTAGRSSLGASYSYDKGVVCPNCRTRNFDLAKCYKCDMRLPAY